MEFDCINTSYGWPSWHTWWLWTIAGCRCEKDGDVESSSLAPESLHQQNHSMLWKKSLKCSTSIITLVTSVQYLLLRTGCWVMNQWNDLPVKQSGAHAARCCNNNDRHTLSHLKSLRLWGVSVRWIPRCDFWWRLPSWRQWQGSWDCALGTWLPAGSRVMSNCMEDRLSTNETFDLFARWINSWCWSNNRCTYLIGGTWEGQRMRWTYCRCGWREEHCRDGSVPRRAFAHFGSFDR